MQKLAGFLIAIVAMLGTMAVSADSAVQVNALNYPAWLVRNYQTLPLRPGTRLKNDDLIRTGEGGRVQLQLADGSVIRLGESSRFVIKQAVVSPATGSVSIPLSFQALRGVFRISSAFLDDTDAGYPMELSIGAINARLRNADFWGRTDLTQDVVCLVEGELSIEASPTGRVDMSRALSCFVKPRDQAPLPVDLVDMQQHQLWMAETDLRVDAGIARQDGQWQLVLISLTDAGRAEQLLNNFHRQGFAVQDKTVLRDGRILHRLLLPGFDSIDAALSSRTRLEQQLGVSQTWVWKAD